MHRDLARLAADFEVEILDAEQLLKILGCLLDGGPSGPSQDIVEQEHLYTSD